MMTRGMVLCAGRGERMRPLTDTIPKPLIKVAGRTLIDRALDQLETGGVDIAVVNVSYKGRMIEDHLATRSSPRIIISHEAPALESGGGVKKALPHLGNNPFFVLNGDAICIDGNIPALQRLQDAWREEIDALLLLQPREKARGYAGGGDFFLEEGGKLKRRGDASHAPFVFTGVQVLHPRLFENSPDGVFSLNVLYNRFKDNEECLKRIAGLMHDGPWLHVGDPAGLALAEEYFRE